MTRTARQFVLSGSDDLDVPVADPYLLLANKLAVRREKDLPHIEVLQRFVEEEAVEAFIEEVQPRARLEPSRQLLEVLHAKTLPKDLGDRLLAHARLPVDYRFLAGRLPTGEQAHKLMELVQDREEELRQEIEAILGRRVFDE